MKTTFLSSATVLVEHKNTKILTDPWLTGEEFYGSWTHYPPLNVDFSKFDDVDYIYISHIHPDHMSQGTLEKLNPNIPVIIHNYDAKYVKMNLERWGRKVIELNHGDKFHCGDGLNIYVYAADDCNPEICFKHFGCGKMESKFGSTGVDTMAVIENGDKTILNINDCPYLLSQRVLNRVLKDHPVIDMLWVGYAGAGGYPQCHEHISDKEKLEVYCPQKKNHFLKMGLDFINKIKPKAYMPFAGTYTLRGKYAYLEKFKGVPELQDALSHYKQNTPSNIKGVLLNSFEWYDLNTGEVSKEYTPVNYNEKMKYIEEVLSKFKYDYEFDPEPTLDQFLEILPKAYERYNNKIKELHFKTDTNIYIHLPEDKMCKISGNGGGFDIISKDKFNDNGYVTYKVDFKLLYRILRGPKYAHWNNAEIGSHLKFFIKPKIYERSLYYSMNYFHA
tara:strand:- start:1248 stop:2585 length:1338 start_codon:yes stop_codon:yes gene_type:complete